MFSVMNRLLVMNWLPAMGLTTNYEVAACYELTSGYKLSVFDEKKQNFFSNDPFLLTIHLYIPTMN